MDGRLFAELTRQVRADAVDVAQRDLRSLVIGDVDAQDTRHPSRSPLDSLRLLWCLGVPRIDGAAGWIRHPCRCLCLGFDEQMTYTLRRRRTILQCSQIRLTLARI